jgi:hypothetical protein
MLARPFFYVLPKWHYPVLIYWRFDEAETRALAKALP